MSEALALPKVVDDWERRLLETGERADRLEEALGTWIETLRVRACARRALPEILVYPFALVVISAGCVTILTWKVMPPLETILTAAGAEFPPMTQWAIRSAHWASNIAPLMIGFVVGLLLVIAIARTRGPLGRLCDHWLFALPLIGPARRALARSTGLEAVAASLDAGDSEAAALHAASQVQASPSGGRAWSLVADSAAEGGDLRGPALLGERFLRLVTTALSAEGRADRLRRLAHRELASWWRRAESTVAWVEPLLMLGLGLFLGAQLVGWWLAIYSTGAVVQP